MTDEVRVVALDRLRPGDIADRSGELLDVVFGWADFARLRRQVAAQCAAAGLTGTRLDDFVLAVHEIAANAIVHAGSGQEAIKRRNDRVLPEHLILGMLHQPEGLAARAIAALGVSPEAARAALVAVLPAAMPDGMTPGHVPFDSRAMKVLELTLREALALGHNYIGTEHILLGLLDEEESLGGGTLAGLGITKERARDWLVPVLEQMAAAKRRPATPD